jgi:hypothetical protein
MDYFVQWAVDIFRSKLIALLEKNPTSYDDLHDLVDDLLNLQQEFEEVVSFVEDVANFSFNAVPQ